MDYCARQDSDLMSVVELMCQFCGYDLCPETMICSVIYADGFKIQIPGLLNKIQTDLLSSFLVGHWKEISKSEHRVAFERILETLNPGALQAVKHLQKVV
jgi:hypothetical protein